MLRIYYYLEHDWRMSKDDFHISYVIPAPECSSGVKVLIKFTGWFLKGSVKLCNKYFTASSLLSNIVLQNVILSFPPEGHITWYLLIQWISSKSELRWKGPQGLFTTQMLARDSCKYYLLISGNLWRDCETCKQRDHLCRFSWKLIPGYFEYNLLITCKSTILCSPSVS